MSCCLNHPSYHSISIQGKSCDQTGSPADRASQINVIKHCFHPKPTLKTSFLSLFNQSADSAAPLHPPQLCCNFQLHALTILIHWECSPTVFFCREYRFQRSICDKPTAQCLPRTTEHAVDEKKMSIFSYSYCSQCQH